MSTLISKAVVHVQFKIQIAVYLKKTFWKIAGDVLVISGFENFGVLLAERGKMKITINYNENN